MERELVQGSPIVLIDVGAHAGEFTQAVRDFSGIKRALLIEPQPHRAAELCHRYWQPEFTILQSAISDTTAEIDLEINRFDATTSILPSFRSIPELAQIDMRADKVIKCPVRTLDSVTADFDSIDLVKLDVQGAEHLVMRGGKETFRRTQLVWCEVSFRPLYQGSALFFDILTLMRELGLMLTAIESGFRSPSGELLQGDALFQRLEPSVTTIS